MYVFLTLVILLINMTSCSDNDYQPKDCDLIFRVAEMTDFSKAITDATAPHDDTKFDHVGMVIWEKGSPRILEASSKTGVTLTSLEDFIKESSAGYVVKRVTVEYLAKQVIEKAKSHIGEPYDWSYLPDNGKMYCSELVYESFISAEGKRIFEAKPMNFRDANGHMPQFWIDLFQKLGEEIPQGVIGTNPNDLSKATVLDEIYNSIKRNQ